MRSKEQDDKWVQRLRKTMELDDKWVQRSGRTNEKQGAG